MCSLALAAAAALGGTPGAAPSAFASPAPQPVVKPWVEGFSASSITVAWRPAPNGVRPDGYLVEYAVRPSSGWTRVSGIADRPRVTLTGLDPATLYSVRVAPVLDGTAGEWTEAGAEPRVVDVAMGDSHACAALADRTVWCWGSNRYGQLGVPTNRLAASPVPIRVPQVAGATRVDSGSGFSCALLSDGTVECWGLNYPGLLGAGPSTGSRSTPEPVSGITSAAAISLGDRHACALLDDGTVWCWGAASVPTSGTAFGTAPAPVPGLTDVEQIAAGFRHTCAVRASGRVSCWGFNASGELGDGSLSASADPVDVVGLGDAVAVSAGAGYSCALRSTQSLVCWGFERPGELRPVRDIPDPTGVWSDGWWSCATTAGGAAFCWSGAIPGTLRGLPARWAEGAVAFAVGVGDLGQNACAIRGAGEVTCYGTNSNGELGNGTVGGSGWQQGTVLGTPPGRPYTAGTAPTRLVVTTESGDPVVGGAITWVSRDGEFESSAPVGLTSGGFALLPRTPAGPVTVSLSRGLLPDGSFVSGEWTASIGAGSATRLVVPDPPGAAERTVRVVLPGGAAVAGAQVRVEGLSVRTSQGGFTFEARGAREGDTDDDGRFVAVGYPRDDDPTVTVAYDDGVLRQIRRDVTMTGGTTIVELSELPWLSLPEGQIQAAAGELVTIAVTAREGPALPAARSREVRGVLVTITPPRGAVQACEGATLKARTDRGGRALLRVCATKSGVYRVQGKGAVSTGAVTMRVRGAAPTSVRALSASSPSAGRLLVTWRKPSYSGGANFPITAYMVTVTGCGPQRSMTLTTRTALAARTQAFAGLPRAARCSVTVTARNAAGESDSLSAAGYVA